MSLMNLKNKLKKQVNTLESSFNNAGKQHPIRQQGASSQMENQYQQPPVSYNSQNIQNQQYNNIAQPSQSYQPRQNISNQYTTQQARYQQPNTYQQSAQQIQQPYNTQSQYHTYNQTNLQNNNKAHNQSQAPQPTTQEVQKNTHTNNQQHKNTQVNTQNTPQSSKLNQQNNNNLIVPDVYNSYQQKYNQAHAKKGFFGKLKNKFKYAGTSSQIDTSGVDKFKNSIIDELGYKSLTNDRHHYLVLATPYHATRGYAEMLQIGGASLTDLPPQLADRIMINFIHFLRAYMADMTFVSIHLPNDSKAQQHYWAGEKRDINYKILRGGLSYHQQKYLLARRKFINAKLKRFQDIDLSVDNQAFVLMLFAKTEDELTRDVQYALAFDRDGDDVLKLSFMSVSQKETFLTRLNNPNISAR